MSDNPSTILFTAAEASATASEYIDTYPREQYLVFVMNQIREKAARGEFSMSWPTYWGQSGRGEINCPPRLVCEELFGRLRALGFIVQPQEFSNDDGSRFTHEVICWTYQPTAKATPQESRP